ncbi:coproporphyrinogen III oxidase [Sphingomonas lacunae]|uniref:Heme chaperone HemW n=1 Tax=Sphingomonas lacunae TaxID=2698828 RepID=A0A6M4AVT3_9SPHN|nr:radical SAM family heme chaperone HemW [Sphingomonas lacunae]QJQ33257.1 coproporphyrinogen III oxidase [Sphingomonas lacunae]
MSAPIALYIHWPFCVSKCPYCDFNSHVRESVDQAQWRDALLADMAHEAGLTAGRRVSSIFFGGGTPSLMPPATVAALIEAAERHWGLTAECEITLEANPNSVEVANFAALASAGVNRVSIGIQALDDETLRFFGRAHSVDEGLAAIAAAQAHFARVSFDLITARPGQSLAEWQAELARALAFGTDHLSLYQLTIEPGTRFKTLFDRGEIILPDEDLSADLFAATAEQTAAAGLPAYEISNHARVGQESRHNLTYWRSGDYVGIGPGAHGRRNGIATERHKKPENWLAAIAGQGHGIKAERHLTPETRATEALLMGLRLREGVDLDHVAALSGVARDRLVDEAAVRRLAGHGLLSLTGPRLAVLPAGMLLLDAILPEVVALG